MARRASGGLMRLNCGKVDIEELKSLCRQYIWYCLIGLSSSGSNYFTGYGYNARRGELHHEITDLLGIKHDNDRLRHLVHNLEIVGFPENAPENDQWNRITRDYGGKLYRKIMDMIDEGIIVPGNGTTHS